ncbi:MAG TPA: hypothetical protein VMW01_12165 [Williamwhitmania sp.]|nr:hypothetical protein [Williamwhitmania sp.]
MKKTRPIRIAILAMIVAVGFSSCSKDSSTPDRQKTSITGQIINSQTGEGLANATLSFYDAASKSPALNDVQQTATSSSAVFVIHTDANGFYNSTEAYVGTFTLIIIADNFYAQTINNFVISLDPLENEFDPITVVQELGTGDGVLRIVLTWGLSPDDLDSHLTGPISGSSSRFHMYYGDSDPISSNVNLDVDDVTSYGPETTTILSYTDGVYRYSVHNYSNSDITGALEIYQSPTTVRVFNNTGLIKTYTAPVTTSTSGDTWVVFEINVSNGTPTIVDKNAYTFVGSDDVAKKK